MNLLRVVGDPNNTPSCSSEIIISNLNRGLQELGWYDDKGLSVVYDCLAQHHGYDTSHIICPYETNIPAFVAQNAAGAKLIGVSHQNQTFFVNGGYPKEKTASFLLGVDAKLWSPTPNRPHRHTFVFGMCCDSNTRAAYLELITAFGEAFAGHREVELYIKDRWATPEFKTLVTTLAQRYDVIIQHDDEHVTDKAKEVQIYDNLDCHVFLNRTSTFALTVAQGMAMQKPTIVMNYSGPRDYCHELNSCPCQYKLVSIEAADIQALEACGLRNYLITDASAFSGLPPQWAQTRIDWVKECLLKVYEDKSYRDNIAYNARVTAEGMTWRRAAMNLALIANEL
jgi:hypothetical protein